MLSRSNVPIRVLVSVLHLLALIALILVCIGTTSPQGIIRSIYLLQIDLTNIVPHATSDAALKNTIIHSYGLRDFYQVGLWNFCQGYNDSGITECSAPNKFYWFDPVEILLSQVLAGSNPALPSKITRALKFVKIISHWMSGCFVAAVILTTLAILLAPLGVSNISLPSELDRPSLARDIPIKIITFLTAFLTMIASIIATTTFLGFRKVLISIPDVNVGAKMGSPMLALMWTASALNLLGFLIQLGTYCGMPRIENGRTRKTIEQDLRNV